MDLCIVPSVTAPTRAPWRPRSAIAILTGGLLWLAAGLLGGGSPAAADVIVSFASPAATMGSLGGDTSILLAVDRTPEQAIALSVAAGGDAVPGVDYELAGIAANPGILTIPAGTAQPKVGIRLRSSAAGKAISLQLTAGTGCVIGATATMRIAVATALVTASQPPPPVITPAAGTYVGSVSAVITGPNGTRYTLDGAQPTWASPLAAGPIPVTASCTVSASVTGRTVVDGIETVYAFWNVQAAYVIVPNTGAWTAPTGFADPEGRWVDEPKAYDPSTASYAADQCNRAGVGPWLELSFAQAVATDRVQVVSDYGFGIVNRVDLEAKTAAGWTPVYSGAILNEAPAVIVFPPLSATAFRYRFNYVVNGYYFWLYDIRAYALPKLIVAPAVRTEAATSVTDASAVLHGSLLVDGGMPCAVRFQYRRAADAAWLATPWQPNVTTGQGSNAVLTRVAGLQSGVEYRFRVQAANDMGQVDGQEQAFTPAVLAPTGAEQWVAASDAAGASATMAWTDPLNAIDDDPQTFATCYHPLWTATASPAVELALPDVVCDSLRLWAGRNPYISDIVVEVAGADGAYAQVYKGAFEDRAWLTVPLPAIAVYRKARIVMTTTTTAVGTNWELGEVQVRVPPRLPPPALAPAAGAYDLPLTATASSTVAGAAFRYTLDGSLPTGASAGTSGPIAVPAPATVTVVATRAGWLDSAPVAVAYAQLVHPQLPAPTLTPASGSYDLPLQVTARCAEPGATFLYTTDGGDPAVQGVASTGAILMPGPGQLQVIARKASWRDSPVATASYAQAPRPPVVAPLAIGPWVGAAATAAVQATDPDTGSAGLSYAWAVSPAGGLAVAGSGTAATLTASRSGTWSVTVTVTDPQGLTAGASATVALAAIPTAIAIEPAQAEVPVLGGAVFTATVADQFGAALQPQPALVWQATAAAGAVDAQGRFTAGAAPAGGVVTVAVQGLPSVAASAAVTVVASQPAVAFATPRVERDLFSYDALTLRLATDRPTQEDVQVTVSLAGALRDSFGAYLFDPQWYMPASDVQVTLPASPATAATAEVLVYVESYGLTADGLAGTAVLSAPVHAVLGSASVAAVVIRPNQAPVITALTATPARVEGATARLTATVTDDGSLTDLDCTWSVASGPGAVAFSAAALTTEATFTRAGRHVLRCEVTDARFAWESLRRSAASQIEVEVVPLARVTADQPVVNPGGTTTARCTDQFGTAMGLVERWEATGGAITADGVFTAGAEAGAASITAVLTGGLPPVTIPIRINAPPRILAIAAEAQPVRGTTTALAVTIADDGGPDQCSVTWSLDLGAPDTRLSANGTPAAAAVVATFTAPGRHPFLCTVTDAQGGTATAALAVQVDAAVQRIGITPSAAVLVLDQACGFTATATDQFGAPVLPAGVTWTADAGSIGADGRFTAPAALGTATVAAVVVAERDGVRGTAGVIIHRAPRVAGFTPDPALVTAAERLRAVIEDDDPASVQTAWTNGDPGLVLMKPAKDERAAVDLLPLGDGIATIGVVLTDRYGVSATAAIPVTVMRVPGSVAVDAQPLAGDAWRCRALVFDGGGLAMLPPPPVQWSAIGGGMVAADGLVQADGSGAAIVVTATCGPVSGRATLIPSGGPGDGDGTGDDTLPPVAPSVDVAIVDGLTGDRYGQMANEAVAFTNRGRIRIRIAMSGGAGYVSGVQVISSRTGTAASALGEVEVPIVEGRQELTARVALSRAGSTAVGVSTTRLVVVGDSVPPQASWVLPAALRQAGEAEFTAMALSSQVYLNAMPESYNRDRRPYAFDRCNRDAFALEALVVDATGLGAGATVAATAGEAPATALSAAIRRRAGPQDQDVVAVTGFGALPDSIVVDEDGAGRITAGNQPVRLQLVDRAGNLATWAPCQLWVKTTAPVAHLAAMPYGGTLRSIAPLTGGEVTVTPVRYVLADCDTTVGVVYDEDSGYFDGLVGGRIPGDPSPAAGVLPRQLLGAWLGPAWDAPDRIPYQLLVQDGAGNEARVEGELAVKTHEVPPPPDNAPTYGVGQLWGTAVHGVHTNTPYGVFNPELGRYESEAEIQARVASRFSPGRWVQYAEQVGGERQGTDHYYDYDLHFSVRSETYRAGTGSPQLELREAPESGSAVAWRFSGYQGISSLGFASSSPDLLTYDYASLLITAPMEDWIWLDGNQGGMPKAYRPLIFTHEWSLGGLTAGLYDLERTHAGDFPYVFAMGSRTLSTYRPYAEVAKQGFQVRGTPLAANQGNWGNEVQGGQVLANARASGLWAVPAAVQGASSWTAAGPRPADLSWTVLIREEMRPGAQATYRFEDASGAISLSNPSTAAAAVVVAQGTLSAHLADQANAFPWECTREGSYPCLTSWKRELHDHSDFRSPVDTEETGVDQSPVPDTFRWATAPPPLRVLGISPDVVVAGGTATITVAGNASALTLPGLPTMTPEAWDAATPEARRGKVRLAVGSATTAVNGRDRGLVSTITLTLDREAPTGLFDVQLTLGPQPVPLGWYDDISSVPPDVIQAFDGPEAGTAFTLKQALRVVRMEWVQPSGADGQVAAVDEFLPSRPLPAVACDPSPSISGGPDGVTVAIQGTVSDPSMDLGARTPVFAGGLAVEGLEVQVAGSPLRRVALTAAAGDGGGDSWRPHPWQARFDTGPIALPRAAGIHPIALRTDANAANRRGGAVVQVLVERKPVLRDLPGGGGAVDGRMVGGLRWLDEAGNSVALWFGTDESLPGAACTAALTTGGPGRRYQGSLGALGVQIDLPAAAQPDAQQCESYAITVTLSGSGWSMPLVGSAVEAAPAGPFALDFPLPTTGGGTAGGTAEVGVVWTARLLSIEGARGGAWRPLGLRVQGVDAAQAQVAVGGRTLPLAERDGWLWPQVDGEPLVLAPVQTDPAGESGVRLLMNGDAPGPVQALSVPLRAELIVGGQRLALPIGVAGWQESDRSEAGSVRRELGRYAHVGLSGPMVRIDETATKVVGDAVRVVGQVWDPLDARSRRSDTVVFVDGHLVEPGAPDAAGVRRFSTDLPLLSDRQLVVTTAWSAAGGQGADRLLVVNGRIQHAPGHALPAGEQSFIIGPKSLHGNLQNGYRIFAEARSGTTTRRIRLRLTEERGLLVAGPFVTARCQVSAIEPNILAALMPTNGEDYGSLLPIEGLQEDVAIIIEQGPALTGNAWRSTTGWQTLASGSNGEATKWERLIMQAGLELADDSPRSLVPYDRTPGPSDDGMTTTTSLRLRTRNLVGGVPAVQAGAAPAACGVLMNMLNGGGSTGNAVATQDSILLTLANGVNRIRAWPTDSEGRSCTALDLWLTAVNGAHPYIPNVAVDFLDGQDLGLSRGSDAFGSLALAQGLGADVGAPQTRVPPGSVILVEFKPEVVNGSEAQRKAFDKALDRFNLRVVGGQFYYDDTALTAGQINGGVTRRQIIRAVLWIMAPQGSSISWVRIFGRAGLREFVSDTPGALGPTGIPTDLMTPVAKRAVEARNRRVAVVNDDEFLTAEEIAAIEDERQWMRARSAELIAGQWRVYDRLFGPGCPGRETIVLDLRRPDAGLKAAYPEADPLDVQKPDFLFGLARAKQGMLGSPRAAFPVGDWTYRLSNYSAVFDAAANRQKYPKVSFNRSGLSRLDGFIQSRFDQGRPIKAIVFTVDGFNNGDGVEVEDNNATLMYDGSRASDPNRLLFQYWPKVQYLLDDQIRNGALAGRGLVFEDLLVVHVWWSGTFLPGYAPGVASGAFFNCNYATAHFTGFNAFSKVLNEAASAVVTTGQRIPIMVMGESTGCRLMVSAVDNLGNQKPSDRERFEQGGSSPLSFALIHPALRQTDTFTGWLDSADLWKAYSEDVWLSPNSDAMSPIMVTRPFSAPHACPESPLIGELRLLGVTSGVDPTEATKRARVVIMRSPFDRPGLAFAVGQASVPSPVNGSYTTMLGRYGLAAPNAGPYRQEQSRGVHAADLYIGQQDGQQPKIEETDYWHVDLWGWNIDEEPFTSRNLIENNELWNGDWREVSISTGVPTLVRVVDTQEKQAELQLKLKAEHLRRGWKWLGELLMDGMVVIPDGNPGLR